MGLMTRSWVAMVPSHDMQTEGGSSSVSQRKKTLTHEKNRSRKLTKLSFSFVSGGGVRLGRVVPRPAKAF
jgi:hypothetical protein